MYTGFLSCQHHGEAEENNLNVLMCHFSFPVLQTIKVIILISSKTITTAQHIPIYYLDCLVGVAIKVVSAVASNTIVHLEAIYISSQCVSSLSQ